MFKIIIKLIVTYTCCWRSSCVGCIYEKILVCFDWVKGRINPLPFTTKFGKFIHGLGWTYHHFRSTMKTAHGLGDFTVVPPLIDTKVVNSISNCMKEGTNGDICASLSDISILLSTYWTLFPLIYTTRLKIWWDELWRALSRKNADNQS